MAPLWSIFVIEFKRFFRLFNILILIAILAVCVFFNLNGIHEYKNVLNEKEEFKKLESLIFKNTDNYTYYSLIGHRVFFVPAASSIFFSNPGAMSEISAHFNSLETLAIYNNCKGKSLFTGSSWRQLRFSYIVFFLGTLLSMFIGHECIRDREYLKSRASTIPYWQAFFYVVIVRFLFIAAVFLLLMGCMILLVLGHNIQLTAHDYTVIVGYVLETLVTLLVFFLIGVVSGIVVPGKWAGAALNMFTWLVIFLIINNTISSIAVGDIDKIPANYDTFNQKLKMLDDYEEYAKKKYGRRKDASAETRRKAAEDYWENFYDNIEAIDIAVKNTISSIIKKYRDMSIIFPTTNYLMVSDEASSRGYENFIAFFDYLVQLRRQFSRFWLDRVYYHDPKEMVNFIKRDENIFKAKSRLPLNYWSGIRVTLLYDLILFLSAFFLFKIFYFKVYNRSLGQLEKLAPKLEPGKITLLLTASDILKNQIHAVLSSYAKGFKGELILDNVNIAETGKGIDFLFLCRPEDIPNDIKVKDFFTYFIRLFKIPEKHAGEIKQRFIPERIWEKRFKKVDKGDRINVLLAVANLKEFPLYVFNDTAAGMHPEFVKQFKKELEALTGKDKSVLYITGDLWHSPMISSEPIKLMKDPEDIRSIYEPNFV
jgi:ABC-type Na+ transport system ATPase subunit NatA